MDALAQRVAARFKAALLTYEEQFKAMHANPPKIESMEGQFAVMVYSPFTKQYIPQGVWNDHAKASEDLADQMKDHHRVVQRLEEAMKEEAAKVAPAAEAVGSGFKVGDLLYTSWGYDQTNIDFYQVVQVKGRTTVVIRQVAEKIVRQGDQEEDVVPEPGKFEGEPLLRRVKPGDRPSVKLESYAWAYLWDGKPKRQTHGG